MKQETTNVFNKGLLMDLNPLTTPNNVVTNCLNGTFITFNGNDVILQNDMGNGKVESAKLPAGYIPLGVKEYGGIIYVVSYNPFTKKGQIGSFPSPEQDFTTSDYDNDLVNVQTSDFWKNEELSTTTVKRYLNKQEIIKVGDLFEICLIDEYNCSRDINGVLITDVNGNVIINDENNILTILNELHNLNPNIGINSGKKILNIKVAAIDTNNNITYLNLDDISYNPDTTTELAKFLMPINKNVADLDDFQAYTYSRNCKLLIIAELESLDSFTLDVESILETQYEYLFKADIQPYDFWRWLEIKLTYRENNSLTTTSETHIIKNVYAKDFPNGTYTDVELLPGITDALYPTNLQFTVDNLQHYGGILDSTHPISWILNMSNRNTYVDYEIIPHMTYGPVDSLKKTGRINVNRFEEDYVNLVKWKYKIVDDQLVIDWGIDCNNITSKELYRIDFDFIEVKHDNPSKLNINAIGVDESGNRIYSKYLSRDYSTSIPLESTPLRGLGEFVSIGTLSNHLDLTIPTRRLETTLGLKKNRLYLCTIRYYRVDTAIVDTNTLTSTSSAWSTFGFENRFVYTNNLMDPFYNVVSDFKEVSPTNSIKIIPQTKQTRAIPEETYNPSTLLSYNPEGNFTSTGIKNTTITVDVNAKAVGQYDIDFTLDIDNINLVVDPHILPKVTGNLTVTSPFTTITGGLTHQTSTTNFLTGNVRLSHINLLHDYNNNDVYTDLQTNPNVSLTINEGTSPIINDDSLLETSKKFTFDIFEKSTFTADKTLTTETLAVYADVLKKYYSEEYYENIFGYDPPIINGNPMPTRAYTHSIAHFITPAGSRVEYPLKTYVEFTWPNSNSGNIRYGENINWGTWDDVQHLMKDNLTPSVSLYTSKHLLSGGGHTIRSSSDYLIAGNGSFRSETINWCYPLLKDKDGIYRYVYIGRSSSGILPIRFDDAYAHFKNMFDDKYVFQATKLNNQLYIPDSANRTFNKYTLTNDIGITLSGSLSNVNYFTDSTLITPDNVTACLSYNSRHTDDIDYSNTNIPTAYTFESGKTSISEVSCDFARLIVNADDWSSVLDNRLFKIVGNEIIDITGTKDNFHNIYNVKDYYIKIGEWYKKGTGLWCVNWSDDTSFRELRLKTPLGLSRLNSPYVYKLGKIVSDWRGKRNPETAVEDVTESKNGWNTYNSLSTTPYNYTIYAKPTNWD